MATDYKSANDRLHAGIMALEADQKLLAAVKFKSWYILQALEHHLRTLRENKATLMEIVESPTIDGQLVPAIFKASARNGAEVMDEHIRDFQQALEYLKEAGL